MLAKSCETAMVHVLGAPEVQRWDTSLSLMSKDQGLPAKITHRSSLEE